MKLDAIRRVDRLCRALDEARREGKSIGLVPTMGALHAGHGSLIDRARGECDVVAVSVFLNPLQFGPTDDLDRYPRDPAKDLLFCEVRGVDLVFAPPDQEIYPDSQRMFVQVGPEGDLLCGAARPDHFRGVATVVLKLLNIVAPDRAYFGEKDYQQLVIMQRMAKDFNLRTAIVPVETQREADGLAISSRNAYLDPEERQAAGVLYRALRVARQRIADGKGDPSVAREAALTVLGLEPAARVEYLEIVDPVDMRPLESISGSVRALGAVWIGNTRLIDNILCEPPNRIRARRAK